MSAIERLSAMTKDCPECSGYELPEAEDVKPCGFCHDTGRVPLFPMLWEDYPDALGNWQTQIREASLDLAVECIRELWPMAQFLIDWEEHRLQLVLKHNSEDPPYTWLFLGGFLSGHEAEAAFGLILETVNTQKEE